MNTLHLQNGMRRAALSLHALTPQDRDWMLQVLPEHQAGALESLLGELRELGIPPGEDLLRDVEVSRAGSEPESKVRQLHRCTPEELARILRQEPAALTGTLLAAHCWSWSDELLRSLDPHLAQRLRNRSPSVRTPALQAAVIAAVRRRLPDSPEQTSRSPSAWIRVAKRLGLRRWT